MVTPGHPGARRTHPLRAAILPVLSGIASLSVSAESAPDAGALLDHRYTDAGHLTLIEFGKYHSFYLQPWRAWLETVPAARLQTVNGRSV